MNPVNLIIDGSLTTPVVAIPTNTIIAYQIKKEQNGTTFNLGTATAATHINLPAPFIGAHYKFMVSAPSGGGLVNTQTITSTGANLQGSMLSLTGVAGASQFSLQSNKTSIELSSTTADVKVGDYIDIVSVDGVNYQFFAFSQSGISAAWTFA